MESQETCGVAPAIPFIQEPDKKAVPELCMLGGFGGGTWHAAVMRGKTPSEGAGEPAMPAVLVQGIANNEGQMLRVLHDRYPGMTQRDANAMWLGETILRWLAGDSTPVEFGK